MEYDDVNKALAEKFPQLEIDETDRDLPYLVAGDFARFLLKAYQEGDMKTLTEGLGFIEDLHLSESHKTRELATVGYLEGIQNNWEHNDVDPELVFEYLGAESKRWWAELNKFWNGESRYIGESFENKVLT